MKFMKTFTTLVTLFCASSAFANGGFICLNSILMSHQGVRMHDYPSNAACLKDLAQAKAGLICVDYELRNTDDRRLNYYPNQASCQADLAKAK